MMIEQTFKAAIAIDIVLNVILIASIWAKFVQDAIAYRYDVARDKELQNSIRESMEQSKKLHSPLKRISAAIVTGDQE